MIGKSQGIGRLSIGLIFAVWAAATIYAIGNLTLAVVYMGAFVLGWLGARAWLRSSGRWRAPIGVGWLALLVALTTVVSNLLHEVTSAVYTYDLTRRVSVELYRSDSFAVEAKWRPGAQTFATLEHPQLSGANPPGVAWLRGRDRSAQKVRDVAGAIGGLWWSRDGTELYALGGGDDSTGAVLDLLTGSLVMSYCTRGGAPGACI